MTQGATLLEPPPTRLPPPPRARPSAGSRPRRLKARTSLLAHGEPMVWLTGGALAVALLMILSLLALVFWQGFDTFWPAPIVQVKTLDGRTLMGEVTRSEKYQPQPGVLDSLAPEIRQRVERNVGQVTRSLIRTGNFELTGDHFAWVSDFQVEERIEPTWAVVVERLEWGRFYGTPVRFTIDGKDVATTTETAWAQFEAHHGEARGRWRQAEHLATHAIGKVNHAEESARLQARQAELDFGAGSTEHAKAGVAYESIAAEARQQYKKIQDEIQSLRQENSRYGLVFQTADGREATLKLEQIVRAYPANQLSVFEKLGVYIARWWEFLTDRPREANSEGGVWPAIFGTVVMTLVMSMLVVPFGVLAALYMREYAKGGFIISAVRIAINNLAGVPSIVFGVFGLGFFIYGVGSYIDGGPQVTMPSNPWIALVIASLAAAAGAVMLTARVAGASKARPASRFLKAANVTLWIIAFGGGVIALATTPYFDGFFQANLPSPTYGKGGLIWASFTLALLTLPVVIVATEEALAAVPSSMREGSYACGASKWQTIWRIVLPRALPGVMTGMILAMARGAGEVAPLMLVGAVKLAPEMPVDGTFPFVHPERSFMHLGFHIYDLGFQSPNSEAAKPMVYTTTLLLIVIIAMMNVAAVRLRTRLRRRFVSGQF